MFIAVFVIEIFTNYWCELADWVKLKVYVFQYFLAHLVRIFEANRAVVFVSSSVPSFLRYKVIIDPAGRILAGWLALALLRVFPSSSLGYGAFKYWEHAGEVRL